ncbi:MAG TPA: dihydropteroate synthase [Beijerinckiaceae bacterium]|nr:dihydropteroate synthase [Beijerinckiaceae bacterium]
MGIVNVTPDSFADGGVHFRAEDAIAGALRMAAEGADILDIGAESTRPGHTPISAEEEWARLEPVLESLAVSGIPLPPISIDTTKAEVARRALRARAAIVNDIWGFQRDRDLPAVAAEFGAAAVLMHNRESIDASIDIADDMLRFFERSLDTARRAGVKDERIVLDPGIGFGKSHAQQFEAIAALPRIKALGFPVLLGVSRKSFIGRLFDPQPPAGERLPGTVAANAIGVMAGADIVRVHDVAAHVQAMGVADRLRRAA